MPLPRKALISLDATPYYHCVSRCVRRAFLCGYDHETGVDYEHRRQWVEDRILAMAEIFAIDVCAYAVMSNHYHVVLHINPQKAGNWSSKEVIQRWHRLFKGSRLSQRFERGEALDTNETETVLAQIECWRERLRDISWFMRLVNEGIARESNQEDQCTGRFWEGRFKSQALLDEQALAACMAYVDLNPIRAKMADTPEQSDHTSIKKRVKSLKQQNNQPKQLLHFIGNPRKNMPNGLPFHLKDYLELVDWTGRIIRDDKRGAIPHNTPPILERMDISAQQWLILSTRFESRFKGIIGKVDTLRRTCQMLKMQRTPNLSTSRLLLN